MHIHIHSPDGEAKFWLLPNIELAKNHGFTEKQLREIKFILKQHYDEIKHSWEKYFRN